MKQEIKTRVVVFGIFDGVHEGHRDFFLQARRSPACWRDKGGSPDMVELIAVVGRDLVALKLKGKKPKFSEHERVLMVEKESLADRVVLGDKELSAYKILEKLKPDVICLGYDQKELKKDLSFWLAKNNQKIKLFTLKPYGSDIFHNSKFSGGAKLRAKLSGA